MKKSNRELKMMARNALRGNYTIPIIASILISALSMAFGSLTTVLFPTNTTLSWIMSQIFSFAVSVILSLFTAGLIYMYLNISRGLPYSFSDLTRMFSRNPDRVLIVGFVLALINLLTTIPSLLVNYIYLNEEALNGSTEALLQALYLTFAVILLGLFLYMILTIPLSMSYYLLADQERLSAQRSNEPQFSADERKLVEILKASVKLYSSVYFIRLHLLYRTTVDYPVLGNGRDIFLSRANRRFASATKQHGHPPDIQGKQ